MNQGNARPRVAKSSVRLLHSERKKEIVAQEMFRSKATIEKPSLSVIDLRMDFVVLADERKIRLITLAANGLPIN